MVMSPSTKPKLSQISFTKKVMVQKAMILNLEEESHGCIYVKVTGTPAKDTKMTILVGVTLKVSPSSVN